MLQCLVNDVGLSLAATPAWMSTGWSYFLVLMGFSAVVFVHELGHFLAAKWAGVRVERFAIGFGRELFGFTKGETRYSFNILPLGGYVKMLGQEDFVVDKSGELKVKEDERSFTNKSIGKRMVIITAGVIMNLFFAAIAFTVVAMVGRKQMPAMVGLVSRNSPAERAGLQPGDRILEINGDEIRSFSELSGRISLSGEDEELVLTIERDGKIVEPKPRVTPAFVEREQVRQLGIGPGQNLRVALSDIRPVENPRPDELHVDDELYGYVVDGEVKVCEDLGAFGRAILGSNGEPIEVIVRRPKDPEALTEDDRFAYHPDIPATEVRGIRVRPIWVPLSYDPENAVSGSLLGLVPRLTILSVTGSFEEAGALPGDIIVRIGDYVYPTATELTRAIEEESENGLVLEVRRPRAANGDLPAEAVSFCDRHREALIAAARERPGAALNLLKKLAQSDGLPQADAEALTKLLADAATGRDWRRALERIDVHRLGTLKPKRPFALFSNPPPSIDATIRAQDESHLVVADVIETFGDRSTPAQRASIPRGAVILKVDDQPVARWYQFCNALRAKAGTTVEIAYRLVDEEIKTKLTVPDCVQAALALGYGDRITRIAGESAATVTSSDGETHRVALPDWRATRELLKRSVGKEVKIEYVTIHGEKRAGFYKVTSDNIDPWLDRLAYDLPIRCYPLMERHPIHNPFVALVRGVKEAHRATLQTILSIRHMVLTRKVGLSKVSGPLGIAQIGSKVAETGFLQLLWFLGLISANLAVINFLPLPIVDGGLFLFLILEKIRGEPVSIKTQVATQLLGIALIATVFLLVTYQDIIKMF